MLADDINTHLASGGVIQLSTHLRSWVYTSKHQGWFKTGNHGDCYVKCGRRWNCLTMNGGKDLLVNIRFGRYVEGGHHDRQ